MTKAKDRNELREKRATELRATQDGTWPRDFDDYMRWKVGTPEYAARMCRAELEYLDGVEVRINNGELPGWEPAPKEPTPHSTGGPQDEPSKRGTRRIQCQA